MELVKLRVNMRGPPRKTKYSSTTDSEPVRRLNDEKHPDKGSEKYLKPYAYKRSEPRHSIALGFTTETQRTQRRHFGLCFRRMVTCIVNYAAQATNQNLSSVPLW